MYLVRSDDVRPCDAIVVLSGDRGERLAEAIRLYHQGIAPVMFITGGPIYSTSHPQLMKNEAVKEGVPPDVIFLEEKSFSTRDHPRQLRAYFDVMNIRSVVLVTSQFHTRRSYDSFYDFYGDQISFFTMGADDGIDYSGWWKSHEMIERILIEWGKTVYYKIFL